MIWDAPDDGTSFISPTLAANQRKSSPECFWAGSLGDSYQTQRKVEQRRAAVEQHGEEGGGGGEEEADVPAHHHPQRLQDLQNNNNKKKVNTNIQRETGFPNSLC